jgi:hypothetical protein
MKRDISVVGIDIAKRVFHLVGMDERGKIVMRKRCSRGEVLPLLANLGPTTIGMALQEQAVPFTTQTRLTFDVVLPLWGHRGPRPTPTVHVHHSRRSARERQRS